MRVMTYVRSAISYENERKLAPSEARWRAWACWSAAIDRGLILG